MGQSIDCQPHFGHQVGRRKASYANHAAQVGEKTAVCLLSDRLLGNRAIDAICTVRPLDSPIGRVPEADWVLCYPPCRNSPFVRCPVFQVHRLTLIVDLRCAVIYHTGHVRKPIQFYIKVMVN